MSIWIICAVSKDYIDILKNAYKTYELALEEFKKANLKRVDDYTFIDDDNFVYKIKEIIVK